MLVCVLDVVISCLISLSDEFNDRILNPDLTEKQMKDLHAEVVDLYNRYCEPNAVEKIKFDEDIIAELKKSKNADQKCSSHIITTYIVKVAPVENSSSGPSSANSNVGGVSTKYHWQAVLVGINSGFAAVAYSLFPNYC